MKKSELTKIILTADVSCIGIPANALAWMRDSGIFTVGDLVRLPRDKALKINGLGAKSVARIDGFLDEYGLSFGMTAFQGKPICESQAAIYYWRIESRLVQDEAREDAYIERAVTAERGAEILTHEKHSLLDQIEKLKADLTASNFDRGRLSNMVEVMRSQIEKI